ncbi:MAG: tripartite tricarboxylate transporter substrate binding protein [Betaproteobacteria bacterium]|nr:tripartite tricarboxylate transporter substrate binding protein [Betaproteobacteria bacterium]
MKTRLLASIMTGIGVLLGISVAWCQSLPYPNRPIHVIVPFPPGGAVDPIARSIGQKLEQAWGQPVLVDNKPGAATIIGADFVAKAAPDGYTMILVATSFSVNPTAYSKLPFDPVKDFTPISLVSRLPLLLAVNPQLPVKSVKELIDHLKAKPGQVNFSSIGNGSTQHLAAELFRSMAGVNMVHVPYKGSGPSMMSVVSGETSVTFESVFLLTPQIKAGKLRALAAAGTHRSPLAPDLPTASESGLPGFNVASWVGFLGPAGIPRDVVQKWHREMSRIMQLPEIRDRQISQGLEPVGSTPEYFAEFIKTEIAKWGKVVKQAGIKLD